MLATARFRRLPVHIQQRLLEIFPGALTWTVLLAPIVIGFIIRLNDPNKLWILGVGAVCLDLYWLRRTTQLVRCARRSQRTIDQTAARDWWQECLALQIAEGAPRPQDIVHCALIPTYTEKYEVLRGTVEALANQNYPDDQRVVAIITRVSDKTGWENVARLREEFGHRFRNFIHIKDPLLPGIVVGKSAAMAYGGPVLKAACDEMGLDPNLTLVTDLDSDFRLHPQYFAYITAEFCGADDRATSIWQPVPVFLNNLWRVPAAIRVMATAATQWQMFLHQNPKRLVMFASYTSSLHLIEDVGYWDDDVIPEDLAFLLEVVLQIRLPLARETGFLTCVR